MYGAAVVVVVVEAVEDVDVLDVEAGVGPVNEDSETPKSASTTPCILATPLKINNVLPLSYSGICTPLPSVDTTTLSATPWCVGGMLPNDGPAKA